MARMVCRLTWLTGSQIYKTPFLSLASTVFRVELFVIFLLDSGAKQLDTDFIICPILCCSILGFKFQVLHVNLGIIVRYNRLDFFRMSGQCSSHSLNNFPRSHLPLSTTSPENSGFLSLPCLVFIGFSLNSTTFLTSAIWKSVVMVLSPSEAHCFGEILEVYVCQRKAILVSKFAFSPENCFVCLAVWVCFVRGVYLFPVGEAVTVLLRVFLGTL